jgi:hypothetical protein
MPLGDLVMECDGGFDSATSRSKQLSPSMQLTADTGQQGERLFKSAVRWGHLGK